MLAWREPAGASAQQTYQNYTGYKSVPAHISPHPCKPADCLAVALQAAQWGMNPYAVAQEAHVINGSLGYEAQLVNTVITSMAPTKHRLHYEWFGPWENVIGKFVEKQSQKGNKYIAPNWTMADEKGCGVRVWATMKGEDEPRILELLLSQAQVRNFTFWGSDPKQQLAYLAVNAGLVCIALKSFSVFTHPTNLNQIKKLKEILPLSVLAMTCIILLMPRKSQNTSNTKISRKRLEALSKYWKHLRRLR